MAVEGLGGKSSGIAFLVSAGIVYEIIAAACSSPQTAELNASIRAYTLMKWVHIGLVQSAAFVAAAAIYDRQHRGAIIAGGSIAAVLLYAQYLHAADTGLRRAGAPTENWAQQAAQAKAA